VRQAQWKETWTMLKDGRLITGAGLDNYQKTLAPYHVPGIFYDDGTDPNFRNHVVWNADYKKKVWRPVEIYLYPHNILLNFWSELGLAGCSCLFGLLESFCLFQSRVYKNTKYKIPNTKYLFLGLFCSMIVIIIHGLVDVPYFKNDLACLFWILMAILSLANLN